MTAIFRQKFKRRKSAATSHNSNSYDARYAENWPQISRRARRLTRNRCVLCQKTATQTHHAVYREHTGNAIAGKEIPGIHVFPLCDRCHNLAHEDFNWKRDFRNPALGNHNTVRFYLRMREGWLSLVK